MFDGYIFNVGQANFSLVVDGEDAVVLDCGASQRNPTLASQYRVKNPPFQEQDGAGIITFKNILQNHGIKNVNIVISHQDADHFDLLTDVANATKQVGANIDKIYIGGMPCNQIITNIVGQTFKSKKAELNDPRIPAKIRYIDQIQHQMDPFGIPHRINPFSQKAKPIIETKDQNENWSVQKVKRSISIPFGNSKARVLLPTCGYNANNQQPSEPNSKSLVTLVRDQNKKALFPGDITEKELDDIISTHPNATRDIGIVLSPHHSTVGADSFRLVSKIAANKTTENYPLVFSSDGFGTEQTNASPDMRFNEIERINKFFTTSRFRGNAYCFQLSRFNIPSYPASKKQKPLNRQFLRLAAGQNPDSETVVESIWDNPPPATTSNTQFAQLAQQQVFPPASNQQRRQKRQKFKKDEYLRTIMKDPAMLRRLDRLAGNKPKKQ